MFKIIACFAPRVNVQELPAAMGWGCRRAGANGICGARGIRYKTFTVVKKDIFAIFNPPAAWYN